MQDAFIWPDFVGREYRVQGNEMSAHTPTLIERFNRLWIGEPMSGCWLWIGTGSRSYGGFAINRKHKPAHRVSYEFFKGPIPLGLDIDHLCGVHACVNPAHLEAVSHRINCQRRSNRKATCPKGHPYSGIDSKGGRICHKCSAANARRYRAALALAKGESQAEAV